VSFSEPNVLILDYAEFKINDEDWIPQEEVLRIDNIVRDRLGLFRKGQRIKQPWVFSPEERAIKAHVTIRFTLNSDFTITEPTKLALEDRDKITIHVNDVAILVPKGEDKSTNWWVDTDIKTVDIASNLIHKGQNTVTLSFDFGALTNIERVYLLGNFSVKLQGHKTTLRPLKTSPLTWGDIVPQGFPFYVGNIIYKCSITVPPAPKYSECHITLSVPKFSSPVLAVSDPKRKKKLGIIAFQPRTLDLGELEEGEHKIEITAYGNRYNSFGHIHAPTWVNACGPFMWRSKFSNS